MGRLPLRLRRLILLKRPRGRSFLFSSSFFLHGGSSSRIPSLVTLWDPLAERLILRRVCRHVRVNLFAAQPQMFQFVLLLLGVFFPRTLVYTTVMFPSR